MLDKGSMVRIVGRRRRMSAPEVFLRSFLRFWLITIIIDSQVQRNLMEFNSKCEIVAIRGGYRLARRWRYIKLSPSSALLLSFSGVCFVLYSFLLVIFVLSCLCCDALDGAL